jgi:hypothetical protein
VVRETLRLGRLKGASAPERRRSLSQKGLPLFKINSTNDLLRWLNQLNRDFYHGRLNKDDVTVFLQIASGFSKVLETKEVSEEIEALEREIEELKEGEDGPGDKTFETNFGEAIKDE